MKKVILSIKPILVIISVIFIAKEIYNFYQKDSIYIEAKTAYSYPVEESISTLTNRK